MKSKRMREGDDDYDDLRDFDYYHNEDIHNDNH